MPFARRPLALGIKHLLSFTGSIGLLAASTPAAHANDVAQASTPSAVTANDTASSGTSQTSGTKAAKADTHQLSAVTVTAQRRPEKIQDVPSTVTAISGNLITASNSGSSAANVTNFVANTSAGSTAPTRPRWWIRGVGTGAQGFDVQSPVGIYFDDVYFSNASATGQPVYDLQRVEVLEGPQGTLWGKNTTGGAINFISVVPSFTPSGYAKADIGSHNDQLYEAAFGGPINQVLAARASFHAESSPGSYKNAFSGTKGPSFHDDAGRIQFLANISPDFTALLNVHFRDYDATGTNWSVIGAGPGGSYYKATPLTPSYAPDPSTDVVSSNAPSTTRVRQQGIALTVNAKLGDNQLTSITGYEKFKTSAFSDSDDTPLELKRGYNIGDTHQLSEEIRLASPRTDRFNWVVGGMYFIEDIDSTTVTSALPHAVTGTTPSSVVPNYLYSSFQQHTDSYSAFASGTFNFTDRFNATAGVRYTQENKDDDLLLLSAAGTAGSTTSLAPYNNVSSWWLPASVDGLKTVGIQNASKRWGAWTYDLTPEFKLTDNARLYLRYAHGFRAGGFNSSATSQANITVVNPEFLTSYELGAKTEWLDGQLIANADVFHYDYSHIQINVVTSGVSFLTNAGAGKADGAEFTLEALPLENLHLRLNTGWLKTRFTDYTTSGISYAGNRFVRSPHLSVVFDADYRVPLPNGDDLLFATDWRYQSKYYFYSNNQVDPNVTQNGYALGDARVSYIAGNLTFTVYAENLTDKIYKEHALLQSNSTAPSPSNIYLGGDAVVWSQGRTVGASVKLKW